MKKIAIICSFFSVFGLSGQAQDGFKLGLTATPTWNWYGSPDQNTSNEGTRIGFNYGLLFDYFLTENYAFHAALLHSFSGGESRLNNADFNSPTIVHKTSHVEIPVALKLFTPEIASSYMKVYGEIGLNLDVTLGAKGDFTFQTQDSLHQNTTEVNLRKDNSILGTEDYKVSIFSAGLHVGAGVHFQQDFGTINVGAYFNNGFIGANNQKDYKLIPRNLGIRIGFYF